MTTGWVRLAEPREACDRHTLRLYHHALTTAPHVGPLLPLAFAAKRDTYEDSTMCLMVYIAAHGALRKVDWVEAAPAFYVAELSPDERSVSYQFRTGNVVYAGSYEGCGCGFQYGEYPADSYEPGELRDRRDSLDAFAKYLRAELSRVGTIGVFACWDGDQGLEPVHHRTLTPAALERDDFFFIKREHSRFVADGAVL